MRADIAIIGGTGIGKRLSALNGLPVALPTVYGTCRGNLIRHGSVLVFAARRHGSGDRRPPHSVNYAALAAGCRQLGVRACISTAAVGSLKPAYGPGTVSVCGDFIDLTSRNQTLFELAAKHTAVDNALSPDVIACLLRAIHQIPSHTDKTVVYAGMNGPRYETKSEIRALKTLGADVVGMTMTTEAISMAEAGVKYGCVAIVSNFAAGMPNAVLDHLDVGIQVDAVGSAVVEALLNAANSFPN